MKNKLKMNCIAWAYLAAIAAMLLSLCADFLMTNAYAKPTSVVFRFLRDVGALFFNNAVPFSAFFCLLFVGSIFFSQVLAENNQDHANHIAPFIMLSICLILTNRLYNTVCLNETMAQIGENFWEFFGFLLVCCLIILLGSFLKKRKDLSQKLADARPAGAQETPTNPKTNGRVQPNASQSLVDTWIISARETAQLRAENRKAKIEERHNKKIKSIKNGDDSDSLGEQVLALILTVLLIAVVICGFVFWHWNIDAAFKWLSETFAKTKAGILNELKENIILIILCGFSVPVLLIIVLLIIYYLVYFFVRTLIYFIFHSREDQRFFKESAQGLKIFFFGIVESVERLLLFIPDFLGVVFEVLLGVCIQQMVQKFFPPKKAKDEAAQAEQSKDQESTGSPVGTH